jgi:DNA-binding LytR/AlgR family response regulator
MNAIIIEDEKLVARELVASIAEIDAGVNLVEILSSVKTAMRWFAENPEPDLVFADIQLSDGVSFDIFDKFKLTCPIIFTTAYNEYAIRAFKVNGIDYLLKPVELDELQRAIDKAKNMVKSKSKVALDLTKLVEALGNSNSSRNTYKEHFLGNLRNSLVPIKTYEIAFFNREMINFFVTKAGEKYILDIDTLDDVEVLLDPDAFYRANRQMIINIDAIQSVKSLTNGKLILKLKSPNHSFEIDISRDKAPVFRRWLEK